MNEPNGTLQWRVEQMELQMRGVPERMAVIELKLSEVTSAAERIANNLQSRDETQARERKSDRRWLIGTVLSATLIVISAMAILVPNL